MISAANPASSMIEELIEVYQRQIVNWTEFGGVDKEVQAFQQPTSSGSQILMQKLVRKGI